MTITEMIDTSVEGFLWERRARSASATSTLAAAAVKAFQDGDNQGYRSARQTLRSAHAAEDATYMLTQRDANAFNALVELQHEDSGIDWSDVYDDPDL